MDVHFVEGEWEILKCGRTAGLRFDSMGTLYAADVALGIFKVNVDTGISRPIGLSREQS